LIKDISKIIKQINGGLFCETANTWIDPSKPVKRAIITHAHFDHLALGCDEYIASIETGLLLKLRLGEKINIKTYDFEEIFYLNGVKFSLHPSGHILGASQIKIVLGDESLLITGDFKRQKDNTCKKFQQVESDFLICESTFGLPIFNWEPTNKIVDEISSWINESENSTSIIFCYSLGKAQRLLSEISNKKIRNVYIHKSINKINTIYKKLGIDMIETKTFDNNLNVSEFKNSLLLLPKSLNNRNFLKKFNKLQTGFASGWMSIRALRKRSGYDKGFAMSDHADWNALIKTILDSKAQRVLLNHGDGEYLAKYLGDKYNICIDPINKVS
tara:strand:- start:2734 stop:3723 length:990 start_codon:yes stop_codon:yes gene_type:complete